ncbi:MAG: NAD-dependent epimerase/dehydratase family protein [Gemmatimonadaceae bacterium]
MKVFVAGASGVIGRALVPRLVEAGHEVVGMSNDDSRNGLLRSLGAQPVSVDVFDRDALTAAVQREHPDALIHELTSLGKGDYAANNRIRKVGTRNLIDAAMAAGIKRVVAQSFCLYAPGTVLATEYDPLDLSSGAFDRSVEGVIALEQTVGEVPIGVILRFGRMYGPGTAFAADGPMADQFRRGEFVATDDVTSFVHVDDVAQAAVLGLAWPKGVVNIVDDEPAPATVWAPVFAAAVGARPPQVKVVPSEMRQRGVSNAKARRELAWQPIHPSWRKEFKQLASAGSEIRRSA